MTLDHAEYRLLYQSQVGSHAQREVRQHLSYLPKLFGESATEEAGRQAVGDGLGTLDQDVFQQGHHHPKRRIQSCSYPRYSLAVGSYL
jgi:hypothetical protein